MEKCSDNSLALVLRVVLHSISTNQQYGEKFMCVCMEKSLHFLFLALHSVSHVPCFEYFIFIISIICLGRYKMNFSMIVNGLSSRLRSTPPTLSVKQADIFSAHCLQCKTNTLYTCKCCGIPCLSHWTGYEILHLVLHHSEQNHVMCVNENVF